MKAYTIDQGIPVPEGRGLLGMVRKLEVGESFLATGKENWQVASSAQKARLEVGGKKRFRVRTTSDGVRIWRVE